MRIFQGKKTLEIPKDQMASFRSKHKKEIARFLNKIRTIRHCQTADDEVFYLAYGNKDSCKGLKTMKKEDIKDLFGDWSGWEYFANKIHLTDFFHLETLDFTMLFCVILLDFGEILSSSFPKHSFAIFITCNQELWEDEEGEESECYFYSTFRFAKIREGEMLWIDPKNCDDSIIYAKVERMNQ